MAKVVRATTPTFMFETSDDVDLTLAPTGAAYVVIGLEVEYAAKRV